MQLFFLFQTSFAIPPPSVRGVLLRGRGRSGHTSPGARLVRLRLSDLRCRK